MSMKNLVICVTPFQMLLANRLISQIGEPSDILVLSYIDSEKYRYYFDLLTSNTLVDNSKFFQLDNFKIKNYFYLRKFFKKKYYNKVIFASINDFFIHSILSFLKGFNGINTFDDGTANIFKNSFYYNRDKESFLRKSFNILFNRWNMDQVKESSKIHYTIYPNISNIIDNTELIDLFTTRLDKLGKQNIKNDFEYIFLGQPFEDPELCPRIFMEIKSYIPSIKYYSHPREAMNSLVEYGISHNDFIISELLVEDYIYHLISSGIRVQVYSISSSALFNIAFWNNVYVHMIKTNTTYSIFKELYDIADKLKIDILNINE